jgi:hypothetical protein
LTNIEKYYFPHVLLSQKEYPFTFTLVLNNGWYKKSPNNGYEVLDIKNIYRILNVIIDNKHMMMNITMVNIEFLILKKNLVDICKTKKIIENI